MGRKYHRKKLNKVNSYDLFNRKKSSAVLSDIDLGCIGKKKVKKADKQKLNQEPSRSFKSFMNLQHESSGFQTCPPEPKMKLPAKCKSHLSDSETHCSKKPEKLKSSRSGNDQSDELFKMVKSTNQDSVTAKPHKQENHEKEKSKKSKGWKSKKEFDLFEKKLTKKQKRREQIRNREREASKINEENNRKDLEERNYFTDKVMLHERVDCPPVLRIPIEKIRTKSAFENKRFAMESSGNSYSVSAKISKWGKQKKLKAGHRNALTPVKPKHSEISDEQLLVERERVIEQYRSNKSTNMKYKSNLTPVEI